MSSAEHEDNPYREAPLQRAMITTIAPASTCQVGDAVASLLRDFH